VLISIVANRQLHRLARTLTFFDALGIGFFCVVGVQKSLTYESTHTAAGILGVFSAVMGGVIRDTLMNETSLIFRKEIYATACLFGAIIYMVLASWEVYTASTAFLSTLTVSTIRLGAVKYTLSLPGIGV